MRPEQVPPGPLLVDTDVVSLLALNEDRSDEFGALIRGHELFVCFVTVAEVETLLRLNVLDANHQAALKTALHQQQRRRLLTMEFRTFRAAFIDIPCQVVKAARGVRWRIQTWNPWLVLSAFFRLLDAL